MQTNWVHSGWVSTCDSRCHESWRDWNEVKLLVP
jgi:hypothetical protein